MRHRETIFLGEILIRFIKIPWKECSNVYEVDLTREFHRRGIQDHYAVRKEVCGHEFRINNPTFPPFDEA